MPKNLQDKIENLIPPQLSAETIQEKLACTRPVRDGVPNISLERRSGKIIIHCYGHGGSGWTMLFGSVNRAIALFLETKPSKSDPIRVVGAGCMGLMCAVELSRLGYNVAGITAKELIDLASWKAAGYFALVSLKTTPEHVKMVQSIGMETFAAYQEIHKGEHPYFLKEAVRWLPVYCSRDTESGVEYLEKNGLIPKVETVTLDFGEGVQHKGFLKYMTFFINGSLMMHCLLDVVQGYNIPIKVKAVKSFDELSETTIFNCTGMGSKELNGDNTLTAVKGHLITLKPALESGYMDYMIHTNVTLNGKTERLYMFPKTESVSPMHTDGIACAGVLGGTFLPEGSGFSDDLEYGKILERAYQFFYDPGSRSQSQS